MNIAQTDPNIMLAAGADPGDGRLDLVVITADDRSALLHLIKRRCVGDHTEWPQLPTIQGRSMILRSSDTSRVRIDDQLCAHPATKIGESVDRG